MVDLDVFWFYNYERTDRMKAQKAQKAQKALTGCFDCRIYGY